MHDGAIPDSKYNSSTLVSANALVLIVLALAPHLELDRFRRGVVACSHLQLRVVDLLFVAECSVQFNA